jgi:hypothetical protein
MSGKTMQGLRHGAVGLRQVLLQVITAMAPTAVTVSLVQNGAVQP